MFKILKYLKDSKRAVCAIIGLLILQAYCDLALPKYTADIVDVGIGQSGIEDWVPEYMREETMEYMLLFAYGDEEEQLIRDSYELADSKSGFAGNADTFYRLADMDKETRKRLKDAMKAPMAMHMILSSSESMELEAWKEELKEAGELQDGEFDKGQILEYMDMVLYKGYSSYGDMSDSMLSQMAISGVRAEYQVLGIDIASVQTKYLLGKGGMMFGLSILMMAAAIAAGFLSARTSAKIGRNLRKRVFHKVVSFSDTEMDRFSTASLITRSTNDIQQVQMVSVMLLRMVLYAPIVGIGGVIKVVNTRTGMGWIIVAAVAAIVLLVLTLMKIALPKFKVMQTLVDRMNLVSREILTGIPVIRAFSREKFEEERFDKANQDLMRTQLFTNRVMTFMMPLMMMIMNGVTVLIVYFGARGVDAGNLQVGDMLAFITYTMQIVMAFLMITMISIMLPRAGVAAERIEEVLRMDISIRDKEETKDGELAQVKGVVRFENVSFKYPGADENALEGIAFTANPGETTAIIGSTGCGKSTLIRLIPRFYDVTEGKITIDGVDIRDLSQHKLHDMLGYVPQKGVLFSGDIQSNIKFGGDFITDDEMEEAARIAQAMEFIGSKPKRFASEIAQGGTNVSGGQKQRLSIARAIAKRPDICLFDDSFSALDYKTDVVLRKALREKLSDATVIIVAQRISTILHADKIIVLDDGRIAGMGRHEELLKTCGAYQEIARSQLSEAELGKGSVSGYER